MCAPCKPIINDGAAAAALRSDMIAKALQCLIDGETLSVTDSGPAADALYLQALADVEYIEAVRAAGVAMAKVVGASPRWQALMERL